MAIVYYYRSMDNFLPLGAGGRVVRADGTIIQLADSVSNITFTGSFAYEASGFPHGRIATIDFVSNGALIVRASSVKADAKAFFLANSAEDADALLFAHADRFIGSAGDDFIKGYGGKDILRGGKGNDRLEGEFDNDRISGGEGDDLLFGGTFQDVLSGGDGNDFLDGGPGHDILFGGAGNDRYLIEIPRNYSGGSSTRIVERAEEGIDRVDTHLDITLGDHVENAHLLGIYNIKAIGNDIGNRLIGNDANNVILAHAGDDFILGRDGDDIILGGTGNDRIEGGTGRDLMNGEAGRDVFVFRTIEDAGLGLARDVLRDFDSGTDILHLAGIDANLYIPGDQAFIWIGTDAFSTTPGELRLNGRVLEGNPSGLDFADFQIAVLPAAGIEVSDILL